LARAIKDVTEASGPPVGYLVGDSNVGGSVGPYYLLTFNSTDGLWILGEQTGFAVQGASNFIGTTNCVPFNVTGDGTLTCDGNLTYSAATGLGATKYRTTSNCSSSASPAVCGTAPAGSVAFPTGVTSVALTVNTTAVTANSQIFFASDDTLGTKLGVTCNSTLATLVGGIAVTGRVAGTSFTLTYSGTIATNPLCVSYSILN